MKLHRLLLRSIRNWTALALLLTGSAAFPQCANNNSFYNVSATPATCPGSITVNCIYGGRYVLVNVVAGNIYTFSTCGGATWDTQITLYPATGGAALAYGDDACGARTNISWVATFTGQVRVLVDRYNCSNISSCAALTISCAAPYTTGDCTYVLNMTDSWGDGWGSSNVGISINGGAYQYFSVTGSNNAVSFGADIGDIVSLVYDDSGPYQSENSFSLSLLGAGPVYISGPAPDDGVVFTGAMDCQPPPAVQQDCVGGMTICNSQAINNNSLHTGVIADLNAGNRGCLASNEQQGTWYYFAPNASGTLGFTITPTASIDYDFAVWGPFASADCPPASSPLRCSYASRNSTYLQTNAYSTGLGNGAVDVSEGQFGNGWVAPIDVVAGEVYILYVDNWSTTGQSFELTWQLSGGSALDCALLPVELIGFEAREQDRAVQLEWTTATEQHSSHFTVQRSPDGRDFRSIGVVPAKGNSVTITHYEMHDRAPLSGTNYYRLQQFDLDGNSITGPIASVRIAARPGSLHPNPTDGPLNIDLPQGTEGLVKMNVRDLFGRSLKRSEFVMEQGMRRVRIDISELSAGQYLIEMILPGNADPLVMPVMRN